MKMLSDYALFTQLCEKRGIAALPEILEAIKNASSTGALRLPCQSIVIPVCEVIGRVLTSSSTIRSVDLSDCMLVSKGLSRILDALCEGSSVTSLNLKGNNISGPTVSQLGEIFHRNNTLKCLNIEWNSLGADTLCFERFCEGLAVNHSIEEVDMRYNQISPHCAEALAKVIKRNKSIKSVNLAWNTLGLQGGQTILSAMGENSSIIKLNLRGNCIPEDVITAIDDITYRNQSREIICSSNVSKPPPRNKVVQDFSTASEKSVEDDLVLRKKKVKKKSKIFSSPSKNLQKRSETSDSESSVLSLNIVGERSKPSESGNLPNVFNENQRTEVSSKITELNKILQDRTAAINKLMSEMSTKDSEIEATKTLVTQLETAIAQLKENHEKITAERVKEIEAMREAQKMNEENWSKIHRDLEENHGLLQAKNREWEAKSRRYERDIHRSSVEIVALREKLLAKSRNCEDLISKHKTEVHRLKRELKERESRHKIELNVLKNTLRETTQALEECQTQLQKSRAELREVTESLSTTRAKLNELEHLSVKYVRLEETLSKLKEEKASVDEKLVDSQRTVASLRRQVASLEGELVEPQRRYDLLKEELEQEKQKTARLKEELVEERARMREQDTQVQKMCQQIASLNAQVTEIQRSHAEELKERDRERKHLKDVIANKDRVLSDLRAEEAQRAGQLYAAFSKYLGSIGPSTT